MLKKLKNNNEGFTIIEVMIVLAIAGLILLIVFLAVPALQRASRNTSRKSDAGHLSSAVNDNGTLPGGPAGATWPADCATIINDAGTLSQYTNGNSFTCGTFAANPQNKFDEEYGYTTQLAGYAGQAMLLDEDAQCPATASTTPTPLAATNSRQAALLYTVEPSSGNWTWDCIQAE
jgi:prepilin-type N-terminal cleavage/methylation domain-containing protein